MAGDLSEKPEGTISRASSHGDSTSETQSTRKAKAEGQEIQVSSDDQVLKKLDSQIVKVGVKEEDIYAHLPPTEAEILKKQVDIPPVKAGGRILYRYATTNDKLI